MKVSRDNFTCPAMDLSALSITTSISTSTIPSSVASPYHGYSTYKPPFTIYKPPFTISKDSDGTWQIVVTTKNNKFARSVLQALLNDCDDLGLEESIEVTEQINKAI